MKAAAEGLNNGAKVNKVKIDTVLWGELLFAGTCEQETDGQLQSIKKKKVKTNNHSSSSKSVLCLTEQKPSEAKRSWLNILVRTSALEHT